MTTQTELLTAADLLRLDGEDVRGELIRGELHRTMPAGRIHGKVAAIIISVLMSHVRPRRLGQVIGTDAGILLERAPDTVREPDVAFISADKLPLDSQDSGYYEGIPISSWKYRPPTTATAKPTTRRVCGSATASPSSG